MKDSRGVYRGQCTKCAQCQEYQPPPPGLGFKCIVCKCPPGSHVNADATLAATSATSSQNSLAGLAVPNGVVIAAPSQSGRCAVPGCGMPVDFDMNTGVEYAFCLQHCHTGSANLPIQFATMQVQDIEMDDDFGGSTFPGGQYDSAASTAAVFNTLNSPFLQPGVAKCAIPECPNPCHVDDDGTVHQCCSRSHAREFEARSTQLQTTTMIQTGASMSFPATAGAVSAPPPPPAQLSSSTLPPSQKCAIAECPNPRYVDESGTVHECCGITHAMEHQRRLALMQQTNQQVIKGVTHCYLPECNRPTWPFMNYCGRTHAQQGKQRNLPPPPSLTSGPAAGTGAAAAAQKDSSLCPIPGCTKPKFVDPNSGVTHDFCGKTHAEEGKRRGIRPQADKPEDECDLPGCTNKKRTEGTVVHDYCCRDHATQDAPNRAARVLTSHSEVQKFLKQFSNLTVVSLDENHHAKPGGQLFNRFKNAFDKLPKDQRKTCLAFHGTAEKNIRNICANGYDPKLRCGQAYGAGEYFATKPNIPLSYCKGGKKMLLNELLLGKAGTHHTQHGDIVVMKNPDHDLPRYVITFK